MWAQVDTIFRQATAQIVDHVANFLPGALVALLLILVTFVVAVLIRMMVARVLRGLEFDRRVHDWGAAGLLGMSSSPRASQTVTRVAYWATVVLGLLVSLTALNATMPSQLAFSVFEYLPHLFAAVMILVVGAFVAGFLARSVLIGAVNMQIHSARLFSLLVKWLVLLITAAMALDHLGIGRNVLLLAFGILFGGVVFALALAVGLGAKDVVSRALERQLREPARGPDDIDHV